MKDNKKQLRIGFCHLDSRWDAFWFIMDAMAKVEAQKLGVELVIKTTQNTPDQALILENLINQHVDALIVAPHTSQDKALNAAVDKANNANIPVIAFDSGIEEATVACTVRSNEEAAVNIIIDYVFKQINGLGKVAYLQGNMDVQAGMLRANSFHTMLQSYPDIDLVFEGEANFRRDLGKIATQKALKNHPDIKAIIAANDVSALGAIDAIEEAGLTGKIVVTGFDAIPEALKAISTGNLLATARKNPQSMVNTALDIALRAINKERLPHLILTETKLLTQENLLDATLESVETLPTVLRSLSETNNQLHLEINRRQQVEDDLKQERNILRTILDTLPDAVFIKDAQSRFITCNARQAYISGVSAPNDLVGKTDLDIFPEFGSHYYADEQALLQSGKPLIDKEELVGENIGKQLWFLTTKVPLHDAKGNIIGLVGIGRDITEYKKTKDAFEESKAFLANIINSIDDPVFVKDEQHRWITINNKFCESMGISREGLLGKSDYDFHPKEEADVFWEKDNFVLQTGQPSINEEQITWGDQPLIISTKKSMFVDSKTGKKYIVGTIRDITDRKITEQELQESRQMLQLVLDTIPVRVFWKDIDLVIQGCNRPFANDVGFNNPEEIIGKTDFDFPWAEYQANLFRADDRQVIQSGIPKLNFEEAQFRPDGTKYWLSTSKAPLVDTDGKTIGVLGTYTDITDRKKAEQELQKSQQILQLILDTIPVRVFWKNTDSVYQGCNKPFANDAGFDTPEELVGKTDFEFVWANYQAELFRIDDKQVIESGIPKLNYEGSQLGPDGIESWLNISKVPLMDADGTIIGVLGTYIDITERKVANEKLKAYAAELERSNRELQDFAYVSSHDLQEPLRKIQAFSNRLETKYGNQLDDNGRDYLNRIQNAAARMQNLIQDLLSFSRVGTKAQTFVLVQLNTIIEGVLSDYELKIEEVSAIIKVDNLPVISADPTQMRQLFQNLISNALKFHKKGTPPFVQIESNLQHVKNLCQITIKDNGIGFDEKYSDRIFGVFQRLHGRSEFEGTGVGLAICRKIVDRHKGKIVAKSTPGQGSTFIVTLPIKQQPND